MALRLRLRLVSNAGLKILEPRFRVDAPSLFSASHERQRGSASQDFWKFNALYALYVSFALLSSAGALGHKHRMILSLIPRHGHPPLNPSVSVDVTLAAAGFGRDEDLQSYE